jgi:hypothetical protein
MVNKLQVEKIQILCTEGIQAMILAQSLHKPYHLLYQRSHRTLFLVSVNIRAPVPHLARIVPWFKRALRNVPMQCIVLVSECASSNAAKRPRWPEGTRLVQTLPSIHSSPTTFYTAHLFS